MNYRRYYVPDSIVFVTQVVYQRQPAFSDPNTVMLLREVMRNVKELHPFAMLAYVILPDHLHLMIRQTDDSNFSRIMHSIKSNFTHQFKQRTGQTRRLRFWQQRFLGSRDPQ